MIERLAFATALLTVPAAAEDEPTPVPGPADIVAQAAASEWRSISPRDLLVMTLAPDAKGAERTVVFQLVPRGYNAAWTNNIRKLAQAHWWDGLAVIRVQDNYVAQWGDPEEDEGDAKPLPEGLGDTSKVPYVRLNARQGATAASLPPPPLRLPDLYAEYAAFDAGFPVAGSGAMRWPVHCYGSVGVARGMEPNRGMGDGLYAVIGHAPRHLDRNIAVVGRVIEGIEHLSTLPRGTGPLGFYETAEERVPIASIRLASELSEAEQPRFEYLDTESATFEKYADARANRRDPFFLVPAGGADVCNVPVPVRRVPPETG